MDLERWRAMGRRIRLGDDEVFVLDTPSGGPRNGPTALVVHGFPTSSVDWAPVLPALSAQRRVVLFDLPGFGLSAKPDRAYSIFSSADAAHAVMEHLGLDEIDLVTHDMGDTVGGELLARSLEGGLLVAGGAVAIRRRVVTNGSIYLDMAKLTDAQHALWSAPDEMLPPGAGVTPELMEIGLAGTLAPPDQAAQRPDPAALRAAAEAVCLENGGRLLPRLIRYLSDRRDHEDRFTGAIETHPSRLGIVWGELDPIAVVGMARQLAERRDDASLEVLEGVGHYPMIEAPQLFADAVLRVLDA